MIFWQIGLVASLLASGAQAGIGALVAEGMTRNSASHQRRMEEIAKSSLRAQGYLEMRQSQDNPAAGTFINQDGSINMTAWENMANEACIRALRNLPVASNPSGTCVCYNLPALDNSTGTFEADLRLFQISAPTGAFAGIPQENIQVGLSYRGASVSPVSVEDAARAIQGTQGLTRRQATNNGDPRLLQKYLFVGQIDKSAMEGSVSMAQIQAHVMPIVTLSAVNTQGMPVSTNVSSNEAAFVAGVFSQEVVLSDFNRAQLAVEEEIARLRNGTTAFVLPGVQIMIFPIGLIITSVWLALGVAAYAYGTYCRYNFRDQYRRRMIRVEKGSIPRI